MSKEKVTSYRLAGMTLEQIDTLAASTGLSKANVVQTAIDRMYQQEIATMNTATKTNLTTLSVDAKPEHDPYSNISGIVSKTVLKLDPRDNTVWVTQEYQSGGTPIDEWNSLVLTWHVSDHPTEDALRRWIDDNMTLLQTVADGYDVEWNGNNHVGTLTPEAHAAAETIEFGLGNGYFDSHYQYWTVEQWTEGILSDITADSTDDDLRNYAAETIASLDDYDTLDTDENGVFDYLVEHRERLIELETE